MSCTHGFFLYQANPGLFDHWLKQEKRGKKGVNITVKYMLCFDSLKRKIKICCD
jgi:hypothetical protein